MPSFTVVKYRNQQGFSTAETIIIFVMVAALTALSLPSFLGWLNNRKLENALVTLEGTLKEAQSNAVNEGISCQLIIPAGDNPTITSQVVPVASPPVPCLPTGSRSFDGIRIERNSGGWTTAGTANVTFDYKGRVSTVASNNSLALSIPNTNTQRRCLVVGFGLGLIRTGINSSGTTCTTTR
uniref:Type 4 prepilin-like protein n=1 Tax=Cyanothece sp. (strain PCC 7425 / ATCC 29141) TaxID=395961 RepID=B8HQ55_CYAP4